MAVTYKPFEGEPIILVTYEGMLSPDTAPQAREQVVRFKKERGNRKIFRIIDFTGAKIDFSTIALGMDADKGEGGIDDPDVTTVFVGSGQMVQIGVTAFKEQKRYGAVNPIELLTSVDAALTLIRAKLVK